MTPQCGVLTLMYMHVYHRVRDSTKLADKMTKAHKRLADSYIGVSAYIGLLSVGKNDPLSR